MALFGEQLSPRVQTGLIVAALVVAGVLAWWLWPSGSPIGDTVSFVCVATGKTYQIDRKNIVSMPVENPSTRQPTLVPCVRRDGKLFVDPHYRDVLTGLAEVNQYVDKSTLEVKSAP